MRDAEIADERDLVLRRGDQMRRVLRPQHFRRMRVERHDHGRAARVFGMPGRSGDDRLMSEVNAVEDANGEKERTGKVAQFRNRSQNLHSLGPAHSRHFRQRQNSRKNIHRSHGLQFFHRDRALDAKPS